MRNGSTAVLNAIREKLSRSKKPYFFALRSCSSGVPVSVGSVGIVDIAWFQAGQDETVEVLAHAIAHHSVVACTPRSTQAQPRPNERREYRLGHKYFPRHRATRSCGRVTNRLRVSTRVTTHQNTSVIRERAIRQTATVPTAGVATLELRPASASQLECAPLPRRAAATSKAASCRPT